MSEHWPGTAVPSRDGTHWGVTGIAPRGATWESLKPVGSPSHLPARTALESEAGASSVDTAVMVAGKHSGSCSTWVEPIPPLKPAS